MGRILPKQQLHNNHNTIINSQFPEQLDEQKKQVESREEKSCLKFIQLDRVERLPIDKSLTNTWEKIFFSILPFGI